MADKNPFHFSIDPEYVSELLEKSVSGTISEHLGNPENIELLGKYLAPLIAKEMQAFELKTNPEFQNYVDILYLNGIASLEPKDSDFNNPNFSGLLKDVSDELGIPVEVDSIYDATRNVYTLMFDFESRVPLRDLRSMFYDMGRYSIESDSTNYLVRGDVHLDNRALDSLKKYLDNHPHSVCVHNYAEVPARRIYLCETFSES